MHVLFIRPTALRMRNKNWIFHMKISNIHVSIHRYADAPIGPPLGLPVCPSVCPSARPVIINGFTMTMCFNNKSISFIFIIPPTQLLLLPLPLWTLPSRSEVASWHIKFNIGPCVHRSPIIDAIWICILIYAQTHTHTESLVRWQHKLTVYTFISYLSIINYLEIQSEVNAL